MTTRCVLCLEKFKIYDLLKITDCGHYYHNYCMLKYNNSNCAICRRLYGDSFCFLFAGNTETDIINPETDGFKILNDFNRQNTNLIEYKKKEDNEKIEIEKLQEHQKIFYSFIKTYLLSFRYKILKASSQGKNCATIYSCDFHEEFQGLSLLYILKGTKDEGREFFKKKKLVSVVNLIQEQFKKYDVAVNTDYLLKKNFLKVYF